MPRTAKGNKIMNAMLDTYGSPKKARNVFYASKNAGTISGVDRPRKKRNKRRKKKRAYARA